MGQALTLSSESTTASKASIVSSLLSILSHRYEPTNIASIYLSFAMSILAGIAVIIWYPLDIIKPEIFTMRREMASWPWGYIWPRKRRIEQEHHKDNYVCGFAFRFEAKIGKTAKNQHSRTLCPSRYAPHLHHFSYPPGISHNAFEHSFFLSLSYMMCNLCLGFGWITSNLPNDYFFRQLRSLHWLIFVHRLATKIYVIFSLYISIKLLAIIDWQKTMVLTSHQIKPFFSLLSYFSVRTTAQLKNCYDSSGRLVLNFPCDPNAEVCPDDVSV